MTIADYSCKAIETGSGTVRTASANVGQVANMRTLSLSLSTEQSSNETVQVAIAMLLDSGVKLVHCDGGICTTFFK